MKQIFKQNRTKHEESLWWKRALSHPLGRFFFGAAGYGVLELLWRGRTHWSMLLAGGICFLVYYKLCRDSQHMPLFVKCLLGASLITSVELMFGTVTSGASNDIERATSIARQMITRFGMSETIGLMALDTVVNPYLDAELRSNASQDAAAKVEREMKQLIANAYESAMKTLRENAGMLNKLAEYLLMHENITGDEFMQILQAEPAPDCCRAEEDGVGGAVVAP